MKSFNYILIILSLVVTSSYGQDVGISGAYSPGPIKEGETSTLTVTWVSFSDIDYPIGEVYIQVNIPKSNYTVIGSPSGNFLTTYFSNLIDSDGDGVWFGFNNVAIPKSITEGIIQFTVRGDLYIAPNINTLLETGFDTYTDKEKEDNIGKAGLAVEKGLPINLLSFTAKKVNNEEVMLNWETATEENFKGFDVEASVDGSKFTKIGYVEGRGSDSKYVMMDRNPFQGVNYYRLKSVDVDGSFVYSDIKAVEITERSRRELAVFPNPFNGGFTLSGLKPGSEIKIHDIKGSVVYTNKTDDSVFRVNVPSLVGGVYNVSVTNSGETISKRLIKID